MGNDVSYWFVRSARQGGGREGSPKNRGGGGQKEAEAALDTKEKEKRKKGKEHVLLIWFYIL